MKKEETCQLTISYTFTHNNRVRSLARLDKNTIHTETIHDTHATTTATSRKTSPHIRSWSHFLPPSEVQNSKDLEFEERKQKTGKDQKMKNKDYRRKKERQTDREIERDRQRQTNRQ